MRKLVLTLLLASLCTPVAAATQQEVFDFAIANHRGTVAAILDAAIEADRALDKEPDAQRNAFGTFGMSHPGLDAFTAAWLRDEPTSARAMVARGWYLYNLGWLMRGEDFVHETKPQAMAAMRRYHGEALDLMLKAAEAEPGLVQASDGVLQLAQTTGYREVIPVELERIMTLRPNRGSLMRAMGTLAPQWGGRWEQVELLCARYAAKITTIAGYDAEVCKIDAVYWADFADGEQRRAAQQLLELNPHPILDYARLREVMAGAGSAAYRKRFLEKVKSQRSLSTDEAEMLDWINTELGGAAGDSFPERDASLAENLFWERANADNNPLNRRAVKQFLWLSSLDARRTGSRFDSADAIARLKRVVQAVPYDWRAWLEIAERTAADGSLKALDAAGPYFHNALAYSGPSYEAVNGVLQARLALITDPMNLIKARDISALSPEALAEVDRVVNCPIIADVQRAALICMNTGREDWDCADGALRKGGPVAQRFGSMMARNSCQAEFQAPLETLQLTPVEIDF